MKSLNKQNIKNIVNGANVLSTGGGGTLSKAYKILDNLNSTIRLTDFKELDPKSTVCTVFGIGGKQNCNPLTATKTALNLFKKITNKNIDALIPVEIGPVSIATCLYLASELNIPILNSDLVGLRSSPEIYLETISLNNLKRTPLAVADDKGNSLLIENINNYKTLESILRNFAINCKGLAFVVGYPLTVDKLSVLTAGNSISLCESIGYELSLIKKGKIAFMDFCLKYELKLLGKGIISDYVTTSENGFEFGRYNVNSSDNIYKVYFKNENIVLIKNNVTILTVPDSIILFDLVKNNGINNFENNKNKKVAILGKRAIPIWRTTKGRKLFNPKTLGINFNQVLL